MIKFIGKSRFSLVCYYIEELSSSNASPIQLQCKSNSAPMQVQSKSNTELEVYCIWNVIAFNEHFIKRIN